MLYSEVEYTKVYLRKRALCSFGRLIGFDAYSLLTWIWNSQEILF
jgi:hypothetical protein